MKLVHYFFIIALAFQIFKSKKINLLWFETHGQGEY